MMSNNPISFSFEYPERLRVLFAGCGGQACRNLLPSLAYAPAQLVATCDIVAERARAVAKQFGAERSYDEFSEMLSSETGDAVFLATGYGVDGKPLYPQMAVEAMNAGFHVWIEKPPAWSSAEIEEMLLVSHRTGKRVAVGFMKMFGAGAQRARRLMERDDFGRVTSIGLRDPEMIPPPEDRQNPKRMMYFLDHIVHPLSLLHSLMGSVERLHLMTGNNGCSIVSLGYPSGACGYLHMPWGQSGNCPKERLEVIGEGANLVLENNRRLTYYKPGSPGEGDFVYGKIGDFTGDTESAPLVWEMDCYSGQLLNNPLFFSGYVPEIVHFLQSILNDKPVQKGNLEDAWHILRLIEALTCAGDEVVHLTQPMHPPTHSPQPS